jgi:murein L,D-transpeptidase YcbB/YkuD
VRTLVLVFLSCLAVPCSAQSVQETLRARVEQLHDGALTAIRGTALKRREAVTHFFQSRGFEPAWAPAAAEQIVGAVRGIEVDGLNPADYHLERLQPLLSATGRSTADEADLQLLLTDAVAALVDEVRYGRVRPVTLDLRWNVDPRDGAPPLETELASIASSATVLEAIEARKPDHFIYRGLRQALAQMRATASAGGWPVVPIGPTLKPGTTDPRIVAVRQRVIAGGYLPSAASADSAIYDAELDAAVKRFQEHHRLRADGAIGRSTVNAMNITAQVRADQLRVNLERARWVLGGLRDTFLLVNLPAFKVYYIRDRKNIWETRSQIGRQARQTPSFRADMRYIVFNPDWIVPPTILAKDVLAGMKKGENTIARKGLTILDRQGRRVDPTAIDWATATAREFPYTLRQPPGPDNALGRVKFIFPNEHAIFLHDTPSRELFSADQRTFSSGCIRIERPLELAEKLLEDQDGGSAAKIQQSIESGRSETVFLREPLPVLIVYWTVSVGASGELRYADDVYKLDIRVLRALDR